MITASLGLSSIRSHATPGASVEQQKNELLRAADTALYRAKEHGKDRCTAASLEDARIPAALLLILASEPRRDVAPEPSGAPLGLPTPLRC